MSGNKRDAKRKLEMTRKADNEQQDRYIKLNEPKFKAYTNQASKSQLIDDKMMVVNTKSGKVLIFAENIVAKMKTCKDSVNATSTNTTNEKTSLFKHIYNTPFYTRCAYTETYKKEKEVRNRIHILKNKDTAHSSLYRTWPRRKESRRKQDKRRKRTRRNDLKTKNNW
jgi:hypothetical protein